MLPLGAAERRVTHKAAANKQQSRICCLRAKQFDGASLPTMTDSPELEPRIVCIFMTGTVVKVTCGLSDDDNVYLLDTSGRPIGDRHCGYQTVDEEVARKVMDAIHRAEDAAKTK
jgi:hypothetical protein